MARTTPLDRPDAGERHPHAPDRPHAPGPHPLGRALTSRSPGPGRVREPAFLAADDALDIGRPEGAPGDPTHAGRPLYWRVATRLLGELREETIPPGERLPGERQLAEHFGVSRETVRQALEVLRRRGLVTTDRRGSHATLSGPPVEHPALTFPVGSDGADPDGPARATVTWETPPPEHARALGLAPHRRTLVHRYEATAADGRGGARRSRRSPRWPCRRWRS
ncbi:hypothetical protein GCM10020256_70460 [Streptomyces thermocoprophilus]